MQDKIFVEGIKIDIKKSVYGDIIKMGIYVPNFEGFMKKHVNSNGWLNIDILDKRTSQGKYACLDNFASSDEPALQRYATEEIIDESEIPF